MSARPVLIKQLTGVCPLRIEPVAPAADEVLVSKPLPGKGETQLRLNVPQAAAPAQLAGILPQNHAALLQSKQATCRKKRHDCPRPLQSTTPDYSRRDSNSSSEIPTSQLSSCKKKPVIPRSVRRKRAQTAGLDPVVFQGLGSRSQGRWPRPS